MKTETVKYEYKTYGEARVKLEAGVYTLSHLQQIVASMLEVNDAVKKSMKVKK